MRKKLLNLNFLMVGIVAAAYLVSVVYQFQTREKLHPEGTLVLRISHSRLEPGYAEALDAIIADFREYKARQGVKVDVQQIRISAGFYEPWLNTQLVGGTAPDIVEQPESKYQMAGVYYTTYFRELDALTDRVNPFNDFDEVLKIVGDLDLHRAVPAEIAQEYADLREPLLVADVVAQIDAPSRELLRNQGHRSTFTDGMLGGYNFSAARYYRFTTSASQRRLFYNKEMIQQAIGQPEPPTTLGAFLEMCARISEMRTEDGRAVAPIAATRDTPLTVFHESYFLPFTFAHSYRINNHLLHGLSRGHYAEYELGRWSMHDPAIAGFYEMVKKLSENMTPSFQSQDRASSTFDFVQGRAAMRVTETEEASTLFLQADFPIGIMEFPYPAPGEEWYELAPYPMREFNRSSGQLSITQQSSNPELALEFMQFWTSRIWNERFNRFANLTPVIRGAEPAERLRPFLPRTKGVMGQPSNVQFRSSGGAAEIAYRGQEWRYLSGEIDYDTFASNVDQIYKDPRIGIDRVWADKWAGEWRLGKRTDSDISLLAGRNLLFAPPGGGDRRALEYMVYRSSLYNNGTHVLYSYDRDRWGSAELPPFPHQ